MASNAKDNNQQPGINENGVNKTFGKSMRTLRTPPNDINGIFLESSCQYCSDFDNVNMVQCDACDTWQHFSCVNVDSSIASVKWECPDCKKKTANLTANIIVSSCSPTQVQFSQAYLHQTQPTEKAISVYSKQSSKMSVRSKQLALQKLEEERDLQDKLDKEERSAKELRNKNYLDAKYKLLEDDEEEELEDHATSNANMKEETRKWVENVSINKVGITSSHEQSQHRPAESYMVQTTSYNIANKNNCSNPTDVTNNSRFLNIASNNIERLHDRIGNASQTICNCMPNIQMSHNSASHVNFTTQQNNGLYQTYGFIPNKRQPILDTSIPILNSFHAWQPGNADTTQSIRPPVCATSIGKEHTPSRNSYQIPKSEQTRIRDRNQQNDEIAYDDVHGRVLNKMQLAARQVMPKDLPHFYGRPEEWPLFISAFDAGLRTCGFSQDENLIRLQRCLKGSALEAVRSRLMLPQNVPSIIATLKMLFGRPDLIIDTLLHKVRAEPGPKVDKLYTIVNYSLSVQNLCSTMAATGMTEYLRNPSLLQELLTKLPPQMRLDWALHKTHLSDVTLSTFADWLSTIAQAASEVSSFSESYRIIDTKVDSRASKAKDFVNTHVGESNSMDSQVDRRTNSSNSKKCCCICGGNCLTVSDCSEFVEADYNEKWNLVKDHGLCRKCLKNHGRQRCRSQSKCNKNGCTFLHHPLLHNNDKDDEKKSEPVNAIVSNHIANHTSHSSVLFRIIPVILHGKDTSIRTYAFLDDGSSVTLIEEEISAMLGLNGEAVPLCMKWTDNTHRTEKDSRQVSLQISNVNNDNKKLPVFNAHTIKNLRLPVQSLNASELSQKFPYLNGIPVNSYQNAIPKILLGLDNIRLSMSMKCRDGAENQPIASKTRLGWTICGPDNGISDVKSRIYHSLSISECAEHDDYLHQQVKYYSLGSMSVEKPLRIIESTNLERAREMLQSATVRNGNPFETRLLWRKDNVELPDSLPIGLQRFKSLEKRLQHDPDVKKVMRQHVKDYVAEVYVSRLSLTESDPCEPTCNLSIFPVMNPSKKGKVRIVWDATAKKRISLCADIREMLRQLRIRESDQRAQRFLWRDEPGGKVKVCVIFGATCHPSSVQFIKTKSVDDENGAVKLVNDVTCSSKNEKLLVRERCRVVSKTLMTVFGLLAHFLDYLKILQNIWRAGIVWNEKLEDQCIELGKSTYRADIPGGSVENGASH